MELPTHPPTLGGEGEVAEDEAGSELARTYARLREALGVTFIPTIYRMLGRWPAYLAAATDALAPRLASDAAEAFATAARAQAVARELPGSPIDAGADTRGVLAVLEKYNTANPRSLLFAAALEPDAPPPPGLMTPGAGARAGDDGAESVALLEEIRARHGGLVLPGVWRELAGWPAVARDAWRGTRLLADVPAFHDARERVRRLALAETAGLTAPDLAERHVPRGDRAEVARIVGWFAHGIPTVLVEIEHLRRLVRV